MPWRRAKLHEKDVWARATGDGDLMSHDGRVEVRYQPGDGRYYMAKLSNVVVTDSKLFPDAFCGEAAAARNAAHVELPFVRRRPNDNAPTSTKQRQAPHSVVEQDSGSPPKPRTPISFEPISGAVEAWTDGACTGNPGPAGIGVVLVDGKRRLEISEYLGHGTNNVAELTAILRTLELVPQECQLTIHSDSQYSIGVLQRGWKAKANKELVASIKNELACRRRACLVYTPGHAGVTLNEQADVLAREAVSTRKSRSAMHPTGSKAKRHSSRDPSGSA